MVGVASGCKIIPIRHSWCHFNNALIGLWDDVLVNAVYYAYDTARADVISNSWGPLTSSVQRDVIAEALTLGRDGKGCVVVFASGNENSTLMDLYFQSIPDVIAVGAINSTGKRANFSNYGSDLDVVAPGVSIPSTDIQGSYGHSSGDYSNSDGTSFAAPHVSGVAALVLSVNPNLTGKQVVYIIESTAQKISQGITDPGTGQIYNYQQYTAALTGRGTTKWDTAWSMLMLRLPWPLCCRKPHRSQPTGLM